MNHHAFLRLITALLALGGVVVLTNIATAAHPPTSDIESLSIEASNALAQTDPQFPPSDRVYPPDAPFASSPAARPPDTEPPAQRTNPYDEAWLALNHGKYDNAWTAEYETRLQQKDTPSTGLERLLDALAPNYGVDVRMSNAAFSGSQNEYQLDINPLNAVYAIAGSNDNRTAGVGIYRTANSGTSWTAQDAPIGTSGCCDPAVAYADDGSVYVGILKTNVNPHVVYHLRSTNNGTTWASLGALLVDDRNNIVVDNGTNSPRHGTIYVTYSDLAASNRIKGYKSTNSGATWSASFFIGGAAPASGYQQSSQPRVGADGTLYVGYQQYLNSAMGCAAGVQNVVAVSTNGGTSFTQTILSATQGGACLAGQAGRGVFCINAGGSTFRSRSHPILATHPSNDDHLYMVYSGGELDTAYVCGGGSGKHSDTLFRRSTNKGVTWSAAIKINNDGTGKDQYFPWIDVSPNGWIWVGWNDRRSDASNYTSRWYQAVSTNEGVSWTQQVVADVATQPSTFIGDYHGLAASNDVVLGTWYDSRNNASGDPYTDPHKPCPLVTTRSGAITTGDPTQAGRLTRDALPSTCLTPKVCPGVFDALARHYDSYTFVNNTAVTQCYSVEIDTTCSGSNFIFAVTYLNSFNPASLCTNYLADMGESPFTNDNYSFSVPAGATFVVVVSEVTADAGCASYTLSLKACSTSGIPPATTTPTRTPTRTPTPCAVGPSVGGAITGGDPLQTGRLFRDGVDSSCAVPKPCPALYNSTPVHYDTHTFVNTSGGPQCIVATLNSTGCGANQIFSAAYLTAYDPNNLCTNYLADSGSSPLPTGSYSFIVPTGGTFVIVVHEVNANAGCPSYTLNVQTCGGTIATPTPPSGPTNTPTLTRTPTHTPTGTPPTATNTPTPPSEETATPGGPVPTDTPEPTDTPGVVATPTSCPVQFVDVPMGSTFYDFVRCLACRGIINGYPCGGPGEPCPGNYYRPGNNVTRGQTSKIIAQSALLNDPIPVDQQTFEDVAPLSTFWEYIERLSGIGAIGGYPCGGPGEPCVAPTNRPYFRPNNNVTRGQLAKIDSIAAGYNETPTGQTFEDVPPGSTFYVWVEQVATRGIIAGYPCGGPGEPCVLPGNRPYFRTNNTATRGQTSKIVANTFFPGCSTPAQMEWKRDDRGTDR